MGKSCAAGDGSGRAWSFTGDWASNLRLLRETRRVFGDNERRGGGCMWTAEEWAVDGWGKTVVCVWLRWMAGEEEEEGMEGIYYFAVQWVSAGGGRMVFRGI